MANICYFTFSSEDFQPILACMCSAPTLIFVIRRICRWNPMLGQTLLVSSLVDEGTRVVETDGRVVLENESKEDTSCGRRWGLCIDLLCYECGHLHLLVLAEI